MRPSETSLGQAWLENFAQPDVPAATMLLDGLRIVTLGTLRNGLDATLNELIHDGRVPSPAVVLPERGLKDFQIADEHLGQPVGYEHFQPGDPVSATPGSEGFVGMVLRDFPGVRQPRLGAPWIRPQATIEELRARRARPS